jgi:predicted NBD/HSP70 family sugar kinase
MMRIQKATHHETKEHNRDLILKTIFETETVSRAEIARMTRLTRTTVSDVVTGLLTEGLVKEVGIGSSIGGKSPILLSLVKDSRYMISLNLAHDQFCGAVVNLRGEIKEMESVPVSDRDGEQALALVYEILDRLVKKQWMPLVGIGVGTPGLVNTRDGMVISAVNLDWQDLPLAQLLRERYRMPVHVMNDSQAAAIGEYVYGGGYKADENLVVINIRQGIGAGILVNGRLFQGDGGGAGEIGHMVVQENGLLCRCGNRGCLETVASARAIVERARMLAADYPSARLAKRPGKIDLDALEQAFADGDPLAKRVITDAGHYLGLSIGSLISVLNVQRFVLIGDMTCFGQPWLDSVRDGARHAALSKLAEGTRIEVGKLDYRGCMMGASALTLLNGYSLLFSQPAFTQN